MKKLLLITLGFIISNCGYNDLKSLPKNFNYFEEKISFFTDRTLYVVGENINFSAYLFFNTNKQVQVKERENEDNSNDKLAFDPQYQLSNIIYIELITPEGEKITGGKFVCEKSICKGCLPIPKDMITGGYYIRAYTKFMRNNGPKSYSYIALKIVNPLKDEVLNSNQNGGAHQNSIKQTDTVSSHNYITATLDKEEYTTRDSVKIELKGARLNNNLIKGFSISVVLDSSNNEVNNVAPLSASILDNQYYYPEIEGISLTGRLKDSKGDKILPNTTVNLSILGDCKDYMAIKTDSLGRFFFKMPIFYGVRDVFLNTELNADSKSNILVDNDFCQNQVKLPAQPFSLTKKEKQIVYSFAQNYQIASYYNKNQKVDTTNKITYAAFYGTPQSKMFVDNYIQLPTIEDYITEVIPTLFIRKNQGKKYFKVFGSQAEMNIYPPLVLLDLIAIDNPEKILSLPPQKISHIEIINSPYVKGDIIYGGIVSIFSKKGDFAGIDLPTSGVFLDYKFYEKCNDTCINYDLSSTQPDTRNTLYWDSNVKLNNKNYSKLSFKTSDTPGKYTVLLRGVTTTGEEFFYKKTFIVSDKKL